MTPLGISAYTATNALGVGNSACLQALKNRSSGLRPVDFPGAELTTWTGQVDGLADYRIEEELRDFDCRNNRLAQLGLAQDQFQQRVEQAIDRYGASRVALILGTSTSGIGALEDTFLQRESGTEPLPQTFKYQQTQNIYSLADFTQHILGIKGVSLVVSTACSSSLKAFAAASRYIDAGLADAAVVGGVDTICLTTLYGFNSLEIVSSQPCRPADIDRDGLSLGEGAGYVLLEPLHPGLDGCVNFLGYGESSDAYHMSAPHPRGKGAELAMIDALRRADLAPADIDYINLHGTATPANDLAEDKAVSKIFQDKVPCSSTKGWTGHLLGAAGITEAIFSVMCLEHSFITGSLYTRTIDPDLWAQIITENLTYAVRRVVTNSFGFGGGNCSLVLGRRDA